MNLLDWLLDSDPAIRWQVLRDLTDSPAEEASAERSRVAVEGWGARLLALQGEDGQWDGGTYFPAPFDDAEPGQPWTATTYSLLLLRDFGLEPCINGMAVALGAYFGEDVDGIVARLLDEQLDDGGWNCEAERGSTRSSFGTTINVLEGLLAYGRATGGPPEAAAARQRGEEYLLERSLLRRKSTGTLIDPKWLQFSYPTRWHYDVLRGLHYFRDAGAAPDARLAEALDLVRSKRQPDGTWLLENSHPGRIHFPLDEGDGRPSRWNTLRALRVLEWAETA